MILVSNRCGGGVPGGVLDGEIQLVLVCSVIICRGGIHTKQELPGLGPKFTPPHFSHGGVGGRVHGEGPRQGEEGSVADGVSKICLRGGLSNVFISSQEFKPQSGQP